MQLLKDSLGLKSSEIRYTSSPAYGLSGGTNPAEQLRQDILAADLFIGLLTAESIESAYVLFELGARWGCNRSIIPLLAGGATPDIIKKPLDVHALSCDDEAKIYRFVEDCAGILSLEPEPVAAYISSVQSLMRESKEHSILNIEEPGDLSSKGLSPEAKESFAINKTKELSPEAKEVLAIIESEQNLEERGITESFDTVTPGHTLFISNATARGTGHKMRTRVFRSIIKELIDANKLYPGEDSMGYGYMSTSKINPELPTFLTADNEVELPSDGLVPLYD